MKVSVCLSGDMADWKKSFISCYDLEKKLKDKYFDISVDFFCHFFDNDFSDNILKRINCKKYKIDNIEKSKNRDEIINKLIKTNFSFDSCIINNTSDLYSMNISSFLKREYEIENDIEYDVCFRLNYNCELSEFELNEIINNIDDIKFNSIYSIRNFRIIEYPFVSTYLDFFFSDSITFDVLSSFYNHLPIIKCNLFNSGYNRGSVFYYFIKMFNISNIALTGDKNHISVNTILEESDTILYCNPMLEPEHEPGLEFGNVGI